MAQFSISLVSFVSAEVSRDKGQMHTVRMAVVAKAIDSALRGNRTEYLSAVAFVSGAKGKLAKAYRAGFTAVPAPEKFPYSGKLSADVAQAINAKATELAGIFSAAFVAEFPLTDAEQTAEDKAKAKADKAAEFDKKAIARASELGYAVPRAMSPSELADAMVQAIKAGQFTGETLATLAQACNEAVKADAVASAAMRQMRKQPASV